jgi:hypothetical protein
MYMELKIQVFWDRYAMFHGNNYLCLGVACCLHYKGSNSLLLGLLKNLKVKAACFSEMSGSIHQWRVSYPRRL